MSAAHRLARGGDHAQVDAISPVAQDFLKTIWATTEWGDSPVTTKELASKFHTSPASVTDTVKRLHTMGLVTHTPYKPVQLTEAGRALAVQMVRRHRLIETLLVERLGYTWEEVHDEAERLEHAVSDDFTARIDALLGFPRFDPHGDPIPFPDGRTQPRPEAILLADARAGEWEVLRVSDADPQVLAQAQELGIAPGATVTVNDAAPPVMASVAQATWVSER